MNWAEYPILYFIRIFSNFIRMSVLHEVWIILLGFILRNGIGIINSLSQEVPAPT
jgi:hypothetical protein